MCKYDDFHIHLDLLSKEESELDLRVMGACGAMRRGLSKPEALKQYDLTEEEYDSNVDRVFNR